MMYGDRPEFVLYREDDPVPIGLVVPGDGVDCFADQVIRLTSDEGVETIHLVTHASYDESVDQTRISFCGKPV